jgi:hypothetical protein
MVPALVQIGIAAAVTLVVSLLLWFLVPSFRGPALSGVAVGAGLLASQIAADLQETRRIQWFLAGAKGAVGAVVAAAAQGWIRSF